MRRGFTLLEMIVASALAAVFMGCVLVSARALARDQRQVERMSAATSPQGMDLLRWDLSNARTMLMDPNRRTLVLAGHNSLAPDTMAPNGRHVRVIYRLRQERNRSMLVREQEYLDDAVRPQRWQEIAAIGVRDFVVTPMSSDIEVVSQEALDEEDDETASANRTIRVPSRVRIRLALQARIHDEEIRTR